MNYTETLSEVQSSLVALQIDVTGLKDRMIRPTRPVLKDAKTFLTYEWVKEVANTPENECVS